MLQQDDLSELVRSTVATALQQARAEKVLVAPGFDQQGDEAIRITIVVNREVGDSLDGRKVVDTLLAIGDSLRSAGDDRFPIVNYVPDDEEELGADP